MDGIRVSRGGRVRLLDITKSMKAATEGKFYKAGPIGTNKTPSGTLKVSGIKTYLEKYPDLYYVFHPHHRVVGTWGQIVDYDPNILEFQSDPRFNSWIFNHETLKYVLSIINTLKQRGDTKENISNYFMTTEDITDSMKEFYKGMLRETTRDKINVTEAYNPFANLIKTAASLGIEVNPKLAPLTLSALIEKHKGTTHRAGTLTEKIQNLTPDKCIDVTGLDVNTKTGARTRPQPKHTGKKFSHQIPNLVSGSLLGYQNAIQVLLEEGVFSQTMLNASLNEVTRKFSGYAYSPLATPMTSPRLVMVSPTRTASPASLTFED